MIIPPHIKLIAAVAGAAGLFSAGLYFGHEWRDRACDEASERDRADRAEALVSELQHNIDYLNSRIAQSHSAMTARDQELALLREEYEHATSAIDSTPDDSGCADRRHPADIARVFRNANGDEGG